MAWLGAGLTVLGTLIADQLSKRAVERSLLAGEERRLLPGVQLANDRNHGVAFGFLAGHYLGVAVAVGLVLLAVLVNFIRHGERPLLWLSTGLLLGGSLGNIIDRLRDGSVTDFIKLPLGWPPFNLADVSIIVGLLILVASFDGGSRRAHTAKTEEQGPSQLEDLQPARRSSPPGLR